MYVLKRLLPISLIAFSIALVGCNTVHGAGQDIAATGNAITKVVTPKKHHHKKMKKTTVNTSSNATSAPASAASTSTTSSGGSQ